MTENQLKLARARQLRNVDLFYDVANGRTLRSAGEPWGIQTQRVRDVIKKMCYQMRREDMESGVTTTPPYISAREFRHRCNFWLPRLDKWMVSHGIH